MADKEWPQGADPAETLQGSDEIGIYQPGATGGSLNRQTTIEDILLTPIGERTLTSGRIDTQELESGTLSVSGWYTIAELDDISINNGICKFVIISANELYSVAVALRVTSVARTHINTNIEIKSRAYQAASSPAQLTSFRLAKSDSVSTTGAKFQVKIDSSSVVAAHISNNLGANSGWELVTPYLDNTPTLPDGVTVGTFLEAGEEFSPSLPSSPSVQGWKFTNDDQVYLCITWPEIPKYGTGLDISTLLTNTRFWTAGGAASLDINDAAVSNFSIQGKEVRCLLTKTNISLNLINNTACFLQIAGSAGIFKIT